MDSVLAIDYGLTDKLSQRFIEPYHTMLHLSGTDLQYHGQLEPSNGTSLMDDFFAGGIGTTWFSELWMI